jgi:hypothetical protein
MFSNVLKERAYYEELKNRIAKKHNQIWKSISGRPFVGNCSYLYAMLKPTSYQDFFDKYLAFINPKDEGIKLKKNQFYGRTIEDLTRLAHYYQEQANDSSFTLEEYFDDIVCHVIIETFDGHKAEKELMKVLTDYGFDVEETEGDMDAEYGVDLIVRKNGELKEYIQVKPISTFVRTNPSLIADRSNFFMKQLKLDEFIENNETNLKKRRIIYMLYDYSHLISTGEVLWYYKDDRVKFYLDELTNTSGIALVKIEDFTAKKLILK